MTAIFLTWVGSDTSILERSLRRKSRFIMEDK